MSYKVGNSQNDYSLTQNDTQCGGLSLKCHRVTVYWDVKIWRTSERSYSCRLYSFKVILNHSKYVQGDHKSFLVILSHLISSQVILSHLESSKLHFGGPPIQYPIYCASVLTTIILCDTKDPFEIKKYCFWGLIQLVTTLFSSQL